MEMLMSLISVVFGLCFFIIPMWAYRRGLKDGLAINNGAKTIMTIPTPLEYIEQRKEIKETKKKEDLAAEGMESIFSFDAGVKHA